MECRNLREKLSAFVDEQLASDEKKAVQEHLDTCPDCVSYLEELRKTVEYARGLEGVEPPSWFSRKVMLNVREEAGQNKGILRKFFYPLYIKIPLEAAAMVAIVITAFYVLRAVQPDVTVERPVSEELSAPAEQYDRFLDQREEMREGMAVPPAVHDEVLPEPLKESEAGKQSFADTFQAPVSRKQEGKPQIKGSAERPEGLQAPVILPKEKKAPKAAVMAPDMEVKGRAEGVMEQDVDAQYMGKDMTAVFILTVDNVEQGILKVTSLVAELGGTILENGFTDGRNIIFATFDTGKISVLSERLKDLGSIEDEKAPEGLSGKIRVKIEILQGHDRNG